MAVGKSSASVSSGGFAAWAVAQQQEKKQARPDQVMMRVIITLAKLIITINSYSSG